MLTASLALLIGAAFPAVSQPVAAAEPCATPADGTYIGTWKYGSLEGSGSSDLTFSATTVSGTVLFVAGPTTVVPGDPISGSISGCDISATVGAFPAVGTLSADGTQMSGSFIGVSGSYWNASLVADQAATVGTSLDTDSEADGVTATDPVETLVVSPVAGSISIQEAISPGGSLGGYTLIDASVWVEAPTATASNPLALTFTLHSSATGGASAASIQVFRNGVPVADCTGAPQAIPDPCVTERADLAGGDVRVAVLTSHASGWNFAVDPNVPTNSPPMADAGGPYSVNEGSSILLSSASASDPDGDPLTYEWSPASLGSLSDTAALIPTYSAIDDGNEALTLTVTDPDGLSDSASATVTVSNVPPELSSISGPIDPVEVNTAVVVGASFTDAGVDDTHSGTWDWGDTTTSAAAITQGAGSGSVSGTHGYAAPGIYEVSLSIDDGDGGAATQSLSYIVVYDPAAGFATGGGWIVPGGDTSDTDDDLPGLDGSSRATFGFVVKYKNGASTVPSGSLEFHYNVGGFKLKSAAMDWLVVTNSNWAHFQGVAEIEGREGLFPFRVDARDDKTGDDRFVLKVWAPGDNPNQNGIVYKASGDLSGGQIKIHS